MKSKQQNRPCFVKLPKGETITLRGQKVTLSRAVMMHLKTTPDADKAATEILNEAAGHDPDDILRIIHDPKGLKRLRIFRQWAKEAGYTVTKKN